MCGEGHINNEVMSPRTRTQIWDMEMCVFEVFDRSRFKARGSWNLSVQFILKLWIWLVHDHTLLSLNVDLGAHCSQNKRSEHLFPSKLEVVCISPDLFYPSFSQTHREQI